MVYFPAVLVSLIALPVALATRQFNVTVGANNQLLYDPPFIHANEGDIVNFIFNPKNHTVTQSAFETPCVPLYGGYDSGFMPVAADATKFPTFTVKVMDDKPIWGYCGQVNHCASGMVFAINAPEAGPNTFDAFLDAAKKTAKTVA
ncbi:Cupredoxin [Infundibulicybe gibba]|nr:Cupredoxin [Infundibulicybe gibba]